MRRLKALIWTVGSGKASWKGWPYSLRLKGQARRTSGNSRQGDVNLGPERECRSIPGRGKRVLKAYWVFLEGEVKVMRAWNK